MIRRDDPLLRESEEVPEELLRALRIAVDDEIPSAARLKRIEGHLVAEVIASGARRSNASDVERWRVVAVARQCREMNGGTPAQPSIRPTRRVTPAQICIAAFAVAAAVWISVLDFRGEHRTTEKLAPSPSPPVAELREVAPAPELASAEPLRVLPSPAPVSPSMADPPSPVVESKAPTPDSSAARPRNAPVLSRTDPWGISSAPKPARPTEKKTAEGAALEEDLLERATRALATDPQKALSLMEQHRATFPSGRLTQERDVIIIQALAKLGRLDAAQAMAKRFLAEHPDSPYAKDVLNMAGVPHL